MRPNKCRRRWYRIVNTYGFHLPKCFINRLKALCPFLSNSTYTIDFFTASKRRVRFSNTCRLFMVCVFSWGFKTSCWRRRLHPCIFQTVCLQPTVDRLCNPISISRRQRFGKEDTRLYIVSVDESVFERGYTLLPNAGLGNLWKWT